MGFITFVTKRCDSFKFAFNGLRTLIVGELNAIIHLVAAIAVIIAGIFSHIELYQWAMIVFAIGFVFAMELINTAIECMADFVSPEKKQAIKIIKDLSAAAVLVSAITAFVVGLIIFVPLIIQAF
ncbi:MAG: diacylglycerol kinase family protein [Bacteroidales bacterium]|nr:diacylglycerol kinase family protein [Bacteroidales bacterium]